MSFHGAREKFSKECIEFLSTVARDGTRQAPDEREEKQALQPQEHLNGHEERELEKPACCRSGEHMSQTKVRSI